MADQFNDSIPAVTNQITEDVADIAETLGFIKDVFQNFCYNWSNTVASQVFPNKMDDDNEVLINIAGSEVISVKATGFDVLNIPQGLDVTAAIHRKIVNIGDWDMDSTPSVSIAHGLTMTKIRAVSAMILPDDSSGLYQITGTIAKTYGFTDTSEIDAWMLIGATNISLCRSTSSVFDAVEFNATSFNRGYLIIDYVD
jgi:hypothetical protein